jgi:predicted tellurium resistance membrane protein TerC
MLTRILLLLAISWIMRLVTPIFTVMAQTVSGKDLILLGGGLFLIGKSTFEIHHKLEGEQGFKQGGKATSFGAAIVQIMLLDIVFSLDSVITAVGMAKHIAIMIAAVIVAVVVMLLFAGSISRFIDRHPTLKMLALSFLLLIGVMLVAEGLHQHINKGYIYFAMAFSLFVELLNLKIIKKHASSSPAPEGASAPPS